MRRFLTLLATLGLTFVTVAQAQTISGTPALAPSAARSGAFPDDGIDDTAALQAYFNTCGDQSFASPGSGGLVLDGGAYTISAPLTATCSIRGAPGTIIRATAAMTHMLQIGRPTSQGYLRVNKLLIQNIEFDQNDLANYGFWARNYSEMNAENLTFRNVKVTGLRLGDPANAGTGGFGAVLKGFRCWRNQNTIPAGSSCLYVDTDTSDTFVADGEPRDTEIGVTTTTGNNKFSGMHAWANSTYGSMQTCFDDQGSANIWTFNQADTCLTYGFRLRGTNTILEFNNVLMTSNGGNDNTADGMHWDTTTGTGATVIGNKFGGGDSSHRLKTDFNITSGTGTMVMGNQVTANVASINTILFAQYGNAANSAALIWGNSTFNFNTGSGRTFMNANGGFQFGSDTRFNTPVTIGNVTPTYSTGELAFAKMSASGTAPGAGIGKLAVVAGTNANTCKLIMYAGTSTTPVTIIDNVGAGC
jgi:hypothetical protein